MLLFKSLSIDVPDLELSELATDHWERYWNDHGVYSHQSMGSKHGLEFFVMDDPHHSSEIFEVEQLTKQGRQGIKMVMEQDGSYWIYA